MVTLSPIWCPVGSAPFARNLAESVRGSGITPQQALAMGDDEMAVQVAHAQIPAGASNLADIVQNAKAFMSGK